MEAKPLLSKPPRRMQATIQALIAVRTMPQSRIRRVVEMAMMLAVPPRMAVSPLPGIRPMMVVRMVVRTTPQSRSQVAV